MDGEREEEVEEEESNWKNYHTLAGFLNVETGQMRCKNETFQ